MKIKETIERECCQAADLAAFTTETRLDGMTCRSRYFRWCRHCGRHWQDHGGSEPEAKGWQPIAWPWEAGQ